MKSSRLYLVLAATLTACATTMPTPPSGFLSNYQHLQSHGESSSASHRADVPIDGSRATIGEIRWLAAPTTEVTPDEQTALLNVLRTELQTAIKQLPQAEGGHPIIVRAAVTRIETVSPVLNAAATVLAFGPWDRGGAATEIEAVDAETGHQIAALQFGYFSPLSDFKARFAKLAPAEIAVRRAASDFVATLKPAVESGTALRRKSAGLSASKDSGR